MLDGYGWFSAVLLVAIVYKVVDYVIRSLRISITYDSCYIFITGCDTGFGNVTAKRLDALGCHVIAGCLTERGEDELKKSCSSRLLTLHLDVTKHDTVTKALDTVKRHLPNDKGLWAVVNNAGIMGPFVPAEWMTLEDFTHVFNVNCLGYVDVTRTFLPLLAFSDKSRIVNVGSVVGRNALFALSAYTISKYGVEAFTDSIRRELGQFRVSVHLIEPGGHRTNFFIKERQVAGITAAWNNASPEIQARYGVKYFNMLVDGMSNFIASSRLDDVADVIEHALFSRFPRARYLVGWDAAAMIVLSWLPEWLSDWLLVFTIMRPRPPPPPDQLTS